MHVRNSVVAALLLVITPVVAAPARPQLGDVSPFDRWSRGQAVLTVAVAPEDLATPYVSPESLARALPHLYPARIRADWCEGKERQRGVVVFENGDVVFWHICAAELIVFEGDQYPGSYGFRAE